MNIDFDITIIGGGVIGLACARALSLNHSVLLVEQHEQLGSDTSSRNSEVIHAGLYYKEGSLKETLCVAGRQQLYRYCEQYNVPFRKTGKLIVAANATGHSKLDTLFAKGQRLNIPLQMLDQASLKEMEPTVAGYAALFSPETGIIDSHTF
ncbi:MAG: FAD-dependent oxidoreductase, partial [Oleibacter sp.]|nr:FAD-dependent oxidoreductase [Thalassolituus sp.]